MYSSLLGDQEWVTSIINALVPTPNYQWANIKSSCLSRICKEYNCTSSSSSSNESFVTGALFTPGKHFHIFLNHGTLCQVLRLSLQSQCLRLCVYRGGTERFSPALCCVFTAAICFSLLDFELVWPIMYSPCTTALPALAGCGEGRGFVKIRRKEDQNCVMFSYDHCKGKAHLFQVLNFTLVVHSVWTAVFFLKSMGALRSAASTFTGLAFFLSRSDKKDSATALFCLAECNVLKSRIAMAAESRTWNLKSK